MLLYISDGVQLSKYGIGPGEQGTLLYVSIFALREDLEGEDPAWW